MLLRTIVLLTTALPLVASADKPARDPVMEIVDYDSKGQVVSRRANFVHDDQGRRLSNKVFDSQGRLLATEKFTYDANGRLAHRRYVLTSGRTKWQWSSIRHDQSGRKLSCDITNGAGKMIGNWVWQYDKDGNLKQRDRHNADGSVRFFYSGITYDQRGNFAKWLRFEPPNRRVGWKSWKFRSK